MVRSRTADAVEIVNDLFSATQTDCLGWSAVDEDFCAASGCALIEDDTRCVAPTDIAHETLLLNFVCFWKLSDDTSLAFSLMGINAVLTWLKLLKYLNVFPNVELMTMTIRSSVGPAFAFMVVFSTVGIGFAVAFTMCLGTGDQLLSYQFSIRYSLIAHM